MAILDINKLNTRQKIWVYQTYEKAQQDSQSKWDHNWKTRAAGNGVLWALYDILGGDGIRALKKPTKGCKFTGPIINFEDIPGRAQRELRHRFKVHNDGYWYMRSQDRRDCQSSAYGHKAECEVMEKLFGRISLTERW